MSQDKKNIFAPFKQNKSLTLLVSLLLLILIFPFFETSRVGTFIFVILHTVVLLTGVYAISYDVRYIAIGTLLASPILVCTWSNVILGSPALDIVGRIADAIFMTYALAALLRRVFSSSIVGLNEIYASICAYILIGVVFAAFYILIELAFPGSFHFTYPYKPGEAAPFLYFSFSALAGGSSDVIAAAPFTRSLALLEVLIGVVYVAVLIGRLISAMDLKAVEDTTRAERHKEEKILHHLLTESLPLRERPVGLILAAVMFNFVTSSLMIQTKLPFFLDSWGTSLAVMLGGWQAGVITAVLYHILICAAHWGWSSWVWVLSSLLIVGGTWVFSRRNWTSIYRPGKMLMAGAVIGILNSALVQLIIYVTDLPSYEGTLAVYRFFLRMTGNGTFAALAEKMFVEIGDKTLSMILAASAVFLLRDLLKNYKTIGHKQKTAKYAGDL